MPLGLRRRFSVVALGALVALAGATLNADPAASGELSHPWLTSGSDPVALNDAIQGNAHKLPAEFSSRLGYADDGLLRVMVATGDRTPALEEFVSRQTSWVKWYFDNPRFYARVTPDQLAAL